MKKVRFALICSIVFMLLNLHHVLAQDYQLLYKTIKFDNRTTEIMLVEKDGEVLYPIRSISDFCGAKVEWDEEKKTVNLQIESNAYTIHIGHSILYKGLLRYDLPSKSTIFEDRTYVSEEAIERIFGFQLIDQNGEILLEKKYNEFVKDDNNTISLLPTEDTYVCGGRFAEKNFGREDVIGFCNTPERVDLYQKGYIKFDISDIPTENLQNVYFRCSAKKNEVIFLSSHRAVKLKMHDVEPKSWSEDTLTFNNQPNIGDYIAEGQTLFAAVNNPKLVDGADITEYVKRKIKEGKTEISFMWDGSQENLQAAYMLSRENSEYSKLPRLTFDYNEKPAAADMSIYDPTEYGNNIEPLDNAKKVIAESTATYEDELEKNEKNDYDYSEYTEKVKAKLRGETEFTLYPTRTVGTLREYDVKSEASELSKYGGDLNRKLDEGTGYFRLENIDGRWWFVDPEGYLFYSAAKVTVRPDDSEEGHIKLKNEYGSKVKWADEQRRYYKSLGFNSFGGWSFLFRPENEDGTFTKPLNLEAVEGETAMPLGSIVVYGVGIKYAKTIGGVVPGGVESFKGGVPPVFNPDFEEKCNEIIKEYVTPWKDNPYIMGWWSDNEIDELPDMLDYAFTMDPNDPLYRYTYVATIEWFKGRTGIKNPTVYDITDKLRDEYREFVYDRYYRIMSEAFHRYAPNHLYFGNRHYEFSTDSKGIFRAASRYCDVISFNLYKKWTPDIVDVWAEYTDKPIIITEWYANPDSAAGGFITDNSTEDCGKFYQNFALRLLEAKNIVGFHYFAKIYDNTMEEYMKQLNYNLYDLIGYFDNRNN